MLAATIERLLIAPKNSVYNSYSWRESFGYRVKKVEKIPEKKILNAVHPYFLQYSNNVIHCVADPQVTDMKAPNSSESGGCLSVDREYKSFKMTSTIHSAQLYYFISLSYVLVISSKPVSLQISNLAIIQN